MSEDRTHDPVVTIGTHPKYHCGKGTIAKKSVHRIESQGVMEKILAQEIANDKAAVDKQ